MIDLDQFFCNKKNLYFIFQIDIFHIIKKGLYVWFRCILNLECKIIIFTRIANVLSNFSIYILYLIVHLLLNTPRSSYVKTLFILLLRIFAFSYIM
jgi:hypothetical protein